jgi:hypothetical protein
MCGAPVCSAVPGQPLAPGLATQAEALPATSGSLPCPDFGTSPSAHFPDDAHLAPAGPNPWAWARSAVTCARLAPPLFLKPVAPSLPPFKAPPPPARSPARLQWETTLKTLLSKGLVKSTEVGPGKVIAGIMKRIDKKAEISNVVA